MHYNPNHILQEVRNKDEVTYLHSLRVAKLLKEFAVFLGQGEETAKLLYEAGLLHDTGKLVIPDEILNKPEKLTEAEYSVMKTHAIKGYEFLKDLGAPDLVLEIAKGHHLSFVGGGYPFPEEKGEKILIYCRMAAIADVYDAIKSKRQYKPEKTLEETIQIMDGMKNLDPELYKSFKKMIKVGN